MKKIKWKNTINSDGFKFYWTFGNVQELDGKKGASIEKRPYRQYEARIFNRNGWIQSETARFWTLSEAKAWANARIMEA